MENTQTQTNITQPTGPSKVGIITCMILMGVLAIGGIGFGVYGMMSRNVPTDTSDLKVQIADEDGTVTTLETEKIETTHDNGTVVTITDSAVSIVANPRDYIYISDFGIKIAKPDDWRSNINQYSFYNGYPQAVDNFEIEERRTGAKIFIGPTSEDACQNLLADGTGGEYRVCFSVDDNAALFMIGTTSLASEDFRNYFMNPDNYSAI